MRSLIIAGRCYSHIATSKFAATVDLGMISVLARRTKRKSIFFGEKRLGPGITRDCTRPGSRRKIPRKTVLVLALLIPLGAGACGWWGDGEMNRDQLLPGIASGGRQIPLFLDRESIALPGNRYGIAITEPGQAQPYLQATYGRPIGSIEDFGAYGFRTIIDLVPLVGQTVQELPKDLPKPMQHYRVSVASPVPERNQIAVFADLVLDTANLPALVIAPSAEALAGMWVAYRLEFGTPPSYAIAEAVAMGLQPEQEAALVRDHAH